MRQLLFKFRCNILISGKIIKEMPGSVASGTLCSIYGLGEYTELSIPLSQSQNSSSSFHVKFRNINE